MGEIRIGFSNHVEYYLKSDYAESFLIDEPIGWSEDDFEIERHKDYHGIFTKISNNLKFIGNAMEYIESAYAIGGINANCSLSKRELTDYNGEIKWIEKYYALADFNTKEIEDGMLSVQFTSNNLAELIRSHEGDEFELERTDSIDDVVLDLIQLNDVEIKGRNIITLGEAEYLKGVYTNDNSGVNSSTPFTKILSEGALRHEDIKVDNYDDDVHMTASNMIYIPTNDPNLLEAKVTINYDINFWMSNVIFWWRFDLVKVRLNEITAVYNEVEVIPIEYRKDVNGNPILDVNGDLIAGRTEAYDGISGMAGHFSYTGKYETTIKWDEGILFRWKFGGTNWTITFKNTDNRSFYKLSEVSYGEPSPKLSFSFIHDVAQRLMYIITGKKDIFYSKYFGRKELGYEEDGFAGLIGLISGFWVRDFKITDENYKSMTFSLKDLMESLRAEFNIGIGVESTLFNERLRFEDLKYFYQSEVVVKFPYPVSNVTSKVDSTLFFSGLHFGYTEGGDYENSNGLDEPNVETEWVTPIRKSENKYEKKSKIRADEYAMELTRRKPKNLYPLEDTGRDDHNWFLDLKRTIGLTFAQRTWNETDIPSRLVKEPTGIYDAISWHSYLFSPLQMLFRHAWVFRGGLEPYLERKIKHTKSKANQNVTTKFVGKDEYSESSDIPVTKLERSRFLPEKITFDHPVDDQLMTWLLGTTPKVINGHLEQIPNLYFKMEWIRDGVVERGYFLKLKSKESGNFEFQKANENLI